MTHSHYWYMLQDQRLQETITITLGDQIFFNHVDLLSNRTMEEKLNYFAQKGTRKPNWVFICMIKFLKFQKERSITIASHVINYEEQTLECYCYLYLQHRPAHQNLCQYFLALKTDPYHHLYFPI